MFGETFHILRRAAMDFFMILRRGSAWQRHLPIVGIGIRLGGRADIVLHMPPYLRSLRRCTRRGRRSAPSLPWMLLWLNLSGVSKSLCHPRISRLYEK
jgi:hypothetical protein